MKLCVQVLNILKLCTCRWGESCSDHFVLQLEINLFSVSFIVQCKRIISLHLWLWLSGASCYLNVHVGYFCPYLPSLPPKKLPINSHFPSSPHLSPWHLLIYFWFLWIYLFWTFHVNGVFHTWSFMTGIFCLTDIFKFHPYCSIYD